MFVAYRNIYMNYTFNLQEHALNLNSYLHAAFIQGIGCVAEEYEICSRPYTFHCQTWYVFTNVILFLLHIFIFFLAPLLKESLLKRSYVNHSFTSFV